MKKRITKVILGAFALATVLTALPLPQALSQAQPQTPANQDEEESLFDLDLPLVERQPYDELTLDEFNSNVVIKVLPSSQPPRHPFPKNGVLKFEAPDLSESILQVPFENIVDFRTFNDMLIVEANRLVKDKKYPKAYRNLLYVYDNGGKGVKQIKDSIMNCLYHDGRINYLDGNFELALSIFEEIYAWNKNFSKDGLRKKPIDIILESIEGNIKQKFDSNQFDKVTAALEQIGDRYGKDSAKMIDRWKANLVKRSDELIADARRLASEGKGKEAHLQGRIANQVIPNRDEALELYEEIVGQFPIVFVGVTNDSAGADPLRLDLWGGRRVGRLTMRSVIEFAGLSDEGGRYEFLNGVLAQADEVGLKFRYTIDPEKQKQGVPPITALELATRLVSMGTYGSPYYRTAFAKVIDTISIEDEFNVLISLRQQFIRPDALVQFRYDDPFSGKPPVQNGKYVLTSKNDNISVYNRNSDYEKLADQQHPEVVEWMFKNPSVATDALISGEVDLIDRVPLTELARLQKTAEVVVRPYVVPTVHMLIPRLRNDFTKDKNYRNGLLRGINRELIVRDMICGGNDIDGCEVISGPFPIGTEENDQIAYGYDMRVRTEPFNNKLGLVLVKTVEQQMLDAMREKGDKNPQIKQPKMVLCHTRDDIPKIACTAIQRMWREIGVTVTLRELAPGLTVPPDDEWDFLYYEMSMQEPLTDTDKIFGAEGLVSNLSAPVQQSLRNLGYADSWQMAGITLRRMHRQIRNDVSILPLWQLKEHYAYRENVREVGRNIIHLYQNVDFWRIDPREKKKEDSAN